MRRLMPQHLMALLYSGIEFVNLQNNALAKVKHYYRFKHWWNAVVAPRKRGINMCIAYGRKN